MIYNITEAAVTGLGDRWRPSIAIVICYDGVQTNPLHDISLAY